MIYRENRQSLLQERLQKVEAKKFSPFLKRRGIIGERRKLDGQLTVKPTFKFRTEKDYNIISSSSLPSTPYVINVPPRDIEEIKRHRKPTSAHRTILQSSKRSRNLKTNYNMNIQHLTGNEQATSEKLSCCTKRELTLEEKMENILQPTLEDSWKIYEIGAKQRRGTCFYNSLLPHPYHRLFFQVGRNCQ